MTNGFAALKVCAHTVEQLQKMGIKKPMPVPVSYTHLIEAVTAKENAFSTCLQRSIDLLNAVAMHYQNGFMLFSLMCCLLYTSRCV